MTFFWYILWSFSNFFFWLYRDAAGFKKWLPLVKLLMSSVLAMKAGSGNLLQHSCPGNPVGRGAWRAPVQLAVGSQTWLSWPCMRGTDTQRVHGVMGMCSQSWAQINQEADDRVVLMAMSVVNENWYLGRKWLSGGMTKLDLRDGGPGGLSKDGNLSWNLNDEIKYMWVEGHLGRPGVGGCLAYT